MLANIDNGIHGTAIISSHHETDGVIGPDGLRVSQVTYVKSYALKLLRGVGEVRLQQCRLSDSSIHFTGYEIFSGAFDDRVGSFIATVSGSVDTATSVVTAKMIINEGSGSSQMYGLSGKGSYAIAKNNYCSFELMLA